MRPFGATALLLLAAITGCAPVGVETETVELTLRLRLAGGHDIGSTPARVYVFADTQPISRTAAYFADGETCALSATPVTTCTMTVPRFGPVSLVVTEPEPAVFVRFAPQSPQDTVRDGRYVEFTGWTDCDDRAERGLCVLRPASDLTIEANFQLMQQVTVYQTGAARMDYVTISAALTLTVPPQRSNILDLAGCRRVLQLAPPCDSVRVVGDAPFHRFTAYVPRQTIVGMFPAGGLETQFVQWDGACIPSIQYDVGVCSLISPSSSGAPILLTARYQWWDCPDGPSDRNSGSCQLMEPGIGQRRTGRN